MPKKKKTKKKTKIEVPQETMDDLASPFEEALNELHAEGDMPLLDDETAKALADEGTKARNFIRKRIKMMWSINPRYWLRK